MLAITLIEVGSLPFVSYQGSRLLPFPVRLARKSSQTGWRVFLVACWTRSNCHLMIHSFVYAGANTILSPSASLCVYDSSARQAASQGMPYKTS